jgi:hypothetical protein
MVESSGSSGSVSGTRAPEQLGGTPHAPEDNARKRFRLERERPDAEKERREPTDRDSEPRDRWDGEGRRDEGTAGQPAPPRVEKPAGSEDRRREGGLDVVA